MYHIGFDRILVFCVDIPEWKQNNFRKNCGRILKVKIIFNRKSPSVHISTLCWHPFRRSIFVRSLVLSDMFFSFFHTIIICADSGEIERISPNFGLRSRYWSIGGASSPSFFVKAFYLDKLPSVGSVFPKFVP